MVWLLDCVYEVVLTEVGSGNAILYYAVVSSIDPLHRRHTSPFQVPSACELLWRLSPSSLELNADIVHE